MIAQIWYGTDNAIILQAAWMRWTCHIGWADAEAGIMHA